MPDVKVSRIIPSSPTHTCDTEYSRQPFGSLVCNHSGRQDFSHRTVPCIGADYAEVVHVQIFQLVASIYKARHAQPKRIFSA